MRGRERRGRGSAAPKKKIIEVTSRTVAIKEDSDKYSDTICQLQKGIFCLVAEERTIEGVVWFQVVCGWLCGVDSMGYPSFKLSSEVQSNKAWAQEYDNRRRISGAITSMLTRAHALHNARRVARSILNFVMRPVGVKLVNLPDVSIEDLMVGLAGAQGLRQAEILELMKVAASQQCNPPKALRDMAKEISDLMGMRPTRWIKEDLNVLETVDVKAHNDDFVMAAARGDKKTFERFLAEGQELAAIHSDLKYTALHAASDFGHGDIVKALIRTGLNVNIRDARKGQTPLHFAGQGGRAEICKTLLENGADRTIPSFSGILPFELADQQGNFECREILKHPPPLIQFVTVVKATTTSITIQWTPPILHETEHSRVTDYVVEWAPVGKAADVGYGDRFYTSKTQYKVNKLQPSSGHSFCIYSRSPAGWSEPSSKLIQFTLPAPPDPPPPPEMLKLSTNAIYLAWHPPAHDNGAKVDMYQLELIDCDMGKTIEIKEQEIADRRAAVSAARKKARRRQKRLANCSLDEESVPELDSIESQSDEDDEDEDDEWEEEEEEDEEEEEGDAFAEGSLASSVEGNITVASSLQDEGSIAMPKKTGGMSMKHRVFKHKQVMKRYKQCMGLEPYRAYQCRVRCHNELGYSTWSEWIGPIVPQPGVYVLEFNREERSARVGWFRPLLSNGRKVKYFEAQIARLDGPISREISVYGEIHPIEKATPLDYATLQADLTTNEVVIKDLQAGSRYVVRVRYLVESGSWSDWAIAFSSDPILVPACAPECPFHLRPALKPSKDLSSLVLSTAEDDADNNDRLELAATISQASITAKLEEPSVTSTAASLVEVDEDGDSVYQVKHDEIVIQWTNGVTNGAPALEFSIEMAKVRDYTQADMEGAFAAAHDPDHKPYDASASKVFGSISKDNTSQKVKNVSKEKSGSVSDSASDEEDEPNENAAFEDASLTTEVVDGSTINMNAAANLNWRNVTKDGHMMGPAAFCMTNLIPGSCYIFRAKVRNEFGWSSMSAASKVITTFPCTPTGKPEAVDVNRNFFYLRWNESDGDSLGLTNLEFQVQIGQVPLGEVARANTLVWNIADTRDAPQLCQKPYVAVMVDKLVSAAVYVCRVRVRTIAGWSAWSEISEPIRTASS